MTTKVRLWFIRETTLARLYSKLPPNRNPDLSTMEDGIWIPRSIVEHTSKEPSGLHIVTLPNWFIEKENL